MGGKITYNRTSYKATFAAEAQRKIEEVSDGGQVSALPPLEL